MQGKVKTAIDAKLKNHQIPLMTNLQGKVKTAIDAKLKNHQIPLMTNYLTALSVLSKDYTTLLQTFKDTVGEKSNRAIIDTDALRDLKKPFSGIEQGLSVIQRETAAIYESIADIIELANPSTSKVIQDLHAAKQVLTDTESKMAAFNQLQSRSSFEEMMAAQTKELRQLSALQDLGYTNKKALSYYQRTDFVMSVAEAEKQSNSQVYRLALQNELAKKLKTSKYSGKAVTQEDNLFFEMYNKLTAWSISSKEGDNDNIRRLEMLFKAYPKSVMTKILKNDEFWMLANKLPSSAQAKLINILSQYEAFGEAVSVGKWVPKVNTIGKAYELFNKATTPVKTLVGAYLKNSSAYKMLKATGSYGGKVLGKAATVVTFADLAVTGISSGVSEYGKSKSVGKGIIGGTIDTVKSVGPLEGMTIGATVGSVIPGIGTALGAGIGGAIGTVNMLGQFWKPRFYDDIKKGAYGLYDGARELGKATIARTGDIVNSASKTIQNTGKAIGNVLGSVRMPKLSWR
ncbi:hypothetical protein D8831_09855 [Streptococcus intermedius]|nr:hypothetical protein D8831_09855 [Streptococcus intermedius]